MTAQTREERLAIGTPAAISAASEGCVAVSVILGTLALAALQTWTGARSTTAAYYGVNLVAACLGVSWLAAALTVAVNHRVAVAAAAAFFTCFTAWRPIDLPVGSFQAPQLLAVAVVAASVFRWMAAGMPPVRRASFPLPLVVLLSVVALASVHTAFIEIRSTEGLAIMRAGRADPSVRAATAVMALLVGMATYFATSQAAKTEAAVRLVVRAWIAGGVVSTLVGIYLGVRYYLPELPMLPVAAALGVSGRGIAPRDVASLSRFGDMMVRISAFASEPRHLSYLLLPVLCFLFVRAVLRTSRRASLPAPGVLSLAVVAIGFAMTASRSAYLLVVVAGAIVVWTIRRELFSSASRFARTAVLLGGATVVMAGVWAIIGGRNPAEFLRLQLSSLTSDSGGSGMPNAIDGLRLAWRMFESSPIFGLGWGSYVYAVQWFPLDFAQQANPNNLYLLMLAETGVTGLAALGWVFLRGARNAFRRLGAGAESLQPQLFALGAALLASCAAFMFWDSIHYTHCWLLLGLIDASRRLADKMAAVPCVSA
jgi:O-antigen ligase